MKISAQQIQAIASASYEIEFSNERAAELADELERHSRDIAQAAQSLEIDDPIWAHRVLMHSDGLSGITTQVTEDE